MIYFTISSFILCSLILWFYVRNIYLVSINIISIVLSILFSFNLSNFLFGGIELVMIIIPAVILLLLYQTICICLIAIKNLEIDLDCLDHKCNILENLSF